VSATGSGRRSDALDILKGLAIVAVIAQHTVPGEQLRELGRNLWIRPAVPIFFIVVGLNLGRALQRRPRSWRAEVEAVAERLDRIVAPLLVAAAALYLAALVGGRFELRPSYLIGALPLEPPGNYFATALVGVVLLSPLLVWAFRRNAVLALIGCVAVNIATELILLRGLGVADRLAAGTAPYWFPAFPLRYLAAVGVGIWLSGHARLTDRRAWPLLALALPSAWLLYAMDAGGEPAAWFPDSFAKAMSFLAVPWSVLLVLVGLSVLPDRARRRPGRLLAAAGRASLQIYVVQMAWLAIWADGGKDTATAPLHLAASLLLGWGLYRLLPGGVFRARRPAGGSTGSSPAGHGDSDARAGRARGPSAG